MNSPQTHPRFSPIQAAAALLLALALSGATVRAQLLEYDGFNYTGTSLDTQSGGIGWGANAWQDTDLDTPLSNDGISLTFPPSVTHTAVGGRIVFPAAGEAERRLGTSMSLALEGGTYYFSALVNRQGDFRFEFIDNGTNVRWLFGAAGDSSTNTGLAGVSAPVYANGIFPVGETVYVVAKLVTRAAAAPGDEFYLNVYRAGDIVPGTEPGAWQVSGAQNSGVVLTRFQIRNISDLPLTVDEIRIGTNYAEVVGGLVSGPPIVTRQPAPVTVYAGANVRFSVDASGQLPLHFQWRQGGNPLPNETNSILNLTNVQPLQAGAYSVTVTNAIGSTNSDPAALNVIAITDTTVGLQALWHFDETTGLLAFDATANHNDGTLFNYAGDDSQWIPSDFNGALDFNRSLSQYVDVPHSASIGANLANRFSVTAWIRSRVDLLANGSTYRVLEKENTFFLLQGTGASGGMNLLVKKNTANVTAGIGETLLANRWYHLAGTYDGTTIRMYLDGVLKTNVPVAAPIDTTTLPLRIGSDYMPTGPGSRFDGAIDEVGIWERPLSAAEIRQLAGQTGPPLILEQPQSQTRYVGGSAAFQVRARGEPPLRYLWYKGTNEIRTATGPTLILSDVQSSDAGEYRCLISNDLDDVFTDVATLTVVAVTNLTDGIEALWHFDDGSGLVAADSSSHGRAGTLVDYADTIPQWVAGQTNGALAFDGYTNRVVVSNSAAMTLSTDASFAFWIRPASYGTLLNAGNFTYNVGRILSKGGYFGIEVVDDPGSVRATIRANGVPAPQYSLQTNQWQHFTVVFSAGLVSFYKNGFRLGDPVPANLGATNANLIVLGNTGESVVTTNLFAGDMDEVAIWNRSLSETEILTLAGRDVAGPPVIVSQPQSATRYVGGSVSFSTDATGKRPVTYTWRHNGAPVGTNANRLVLTNLTLADAGSYTVTVQNDLNAATSTPPATLTVLQITNVATGLVAYWTFDETNGTVFNDASGRGHNATLQNGTIVPGTLGIVGGAYDFDGADDFAIVPHAAELNLADQASVSVWVNPRSLGLVGGLGRIVRKDINVDFTLVAAGSTFRIYGGLNKAQYDAPANSAATNQWQHLAVVTKDGMLEFFRNGRSLGPPFPGFFGPENLNDLIIANFGPDLSINRVFSGYMDELGLWNRALSASEVDGIYQNGLVAQGLNAPFVPFAIEEIDFPSAGQVRVVFFSPYTGRDHAIQRKDDLGAASWTDQTPATLTALGGGHVQALFDKPAGDAFFRVVALPKPLLFADDFETGGPGWTHGGSGDNWEVGTPVNGPGAAFGGTNVYATDLDGNIQPFSDAYLRSPTINLTGASRATLTFQEWRNVDPDPTFHGTIVNVLDAGTQALITQLSVQAGATAGWQPRTLQLPPLALGKNVMLEFRLYCDNFNLLEGWYIDDVKLSPE
jgi:hypothetical protein